MVKRFQAPLHKIGGGDQISPTGTPVVLPNTDNVKYIIQQATKENVQDYVAALFVSAPHVNLSVNYDDAGNLLAFSVNVDDAVEDAVEDAIAASRKRYEHDQPSPSASWVVNHNLGDRPFAVHVVDTSGDDVMGDIQHTSVNTLIITFSAAFAGRAYIGA